MWVRHLVSGNALEFEFVKEEIVVVGVLHKEMFVKTLLCTMTLIGKYGLDRTLGYILGCLGVYGCEGVLFHAMYRSA